MLNNHEQMLKLVYPQDSLQLPLWSLSAGDLNSRVFVLELPGHSLYASRGYLWQPTDMILGATPRIKVLHHWHRRGNNVK